MYNKNMNKGKICTIKDMDRINKRRNKRSFPSLKMNKQGPRYPKACGTT